MRRPLNTKSLARAQTSMVRTFPAPVGGWNARDALAAMKPTDAVILKNWFPTPSYCEFRGGSASHATGMTGTGKTLMVYNKLTGSNQLFCTTASGIYNVSSAGAVGASVLARTNGKHQWTMFGDGTNNWLIGCNGVDKPCYYDGTTWTAVDSGTSPALTGITTTELVSVNVFKGRLIFLANNSLSFWYLSAGVAGGALTEFDLSGEARAGGYLVAMGTWTRDAGDGADDVAVFLTSEGEAIVYQGTNPSSSTTWAKVGSFKIGRPIGRRCITQYGGDCLILTEEGVFPMAALLQAGEPERGKFALSFKIQTAFTEAARSYSSVFGWSMQVYPAHNALLVNVPQAEDGTHEQYVMNTITKAWTKFTGWEAETFAVFNGALYYADGTSVIKAWTGTADQGANITFFGKQAFMDFGDGRNKQLKLFQPVMATSGDMAFGADVDMDFEDDEITGVVSYSVVSGAVWDQDNWDEAYWGQGMEIVKLWTSPQEWQGRWMAVKVKIASSALTCQWSGNTVIYEPAQAF